MSGSGRDDLLARIRAALGDRPRAPDALAEIERRMARPPVVPRPPPSGDPVDTLIAKAEANHVTVERIASLQMLVPAVRALLPQGRSPDISVAPALAYLGWPSDWLINFGAGRRTERVSVTPAVAGIAETGSVVLRSDASTPTTLNFLPDMHVVVLRVCDVVPYLEDAWSLLRARGEDWPRTVNIITGPSRTADVGGVIVRPAHGPKTVHLVLCES